MSKKFRNLFCNVPISILKQRKARMRLACLDYPKITKLAETGTFGNFPHTGIEDGMEMVYITG